MRHDPHQDHHQQQQQQQQQQQENEEEEPQGGADYDHLTLQTSQIYFGGDKNDPLLLHTRQSRTSDEDTFTSTTSPTSTTSLLVEQKYIPNSISIENKKNKKIILERMVHKEYYNTEQQNLNTVQGDPYKDEIWNDDELEESMSSSIHVRQFKPIISSTASQMKFVNGQDYVFIVYVKNSNDYLTIQPRVLKTLVDVLTSHLQQQLQQIGFNNIWCFIRFSILW